jgi:hypothetical protein
VVYSLTEHHAGFCEFSSGGSIVSGGLLFYEIAIQTWRKSTHWILLFMWLVIPLAFVIQRGSGDNFVMSITLSLVAILLLPRRRFRAFVENRFEQLVSDIPFYQAQRHPILSGWMGILCYAVIVFFFFLP